MSRAVKPARKEILDKLDNNVCEICKEPIKTMVFKYTGVCSENHRKERERLNRLEALAAHPSNFRAQILKETA